MEVQLVNAHSFHPSLSISLASSVLGSVPVDCSPSVLLHLPEGVFFDPFTANQTLHRQTANPAYSIVHLADSVELEHAVGWAHRAGAYKEGVESVIVQLDADRLRADDGFTLNIPLHLRYHTPSPASSSSKSAWKELAQLARQVVSQQEEVSVETTIASPTLVLTCPEQKSSRYVQGFISSHLDSLLPNSHKHLIPHNRNVLSLTASKHHDSQLTLKIPVPNQAWLAPIRASTLAAVLAAALAVLFHLLVHILPALERVESSL